MSGLLIVRPLPFTATANRGVGAENLASRDPKEVWADAGVSSPATITFDLGVDRLIDTVMLGYIRPPAAGSVWIATGRTSANAQVPLTVGTPYAPLRVEDVTGEFPAISHALVRFPAGSYRYVDIQIAQPAGFEPLTAGVAVVGRAFEATLGREWGFGRQPLDTGSATPLPGGGFAVVDGAKKLRASWTFGDLSAAETDALEAIALQIGRTAPALVIEDADRTAGLRHRIHYGLVDWRSWERRNRPQTRWELSIEEWA